MSLKLKINEILFFLSFSGMFSLSILVTIHCNLIMMFNCKYCLVIDFNIGCGFRSVESNVLENNSNTKKFGKFEEFHYIKLKSEIWNENWKKNEILKLYELNQIL